MDFAGLLRTLDDGAVRFIVVGGVAANIHGAIRTTRDLDLVYSREPANLQAIERALAPIHPRLRGAPPGLPFRLDAPTLSAGLNFTLTTDLGDLDLLGEIAGGGRYEDLLPKSRRRDAFGGRHFFVDLDTLIHLKRAAGRPKDFEGLAELELLRDGVPPAR